MKNFFKIFMRLIGPIGLIGLIGIVVAHQVGNVDTNNQPGEHWAWNDVAGWLDFHFSHTAGDDNVFVSGNELRGWANSSVGTVALNCATTPNGDICGSTEFKINQDPANSGDLAGWGWNENVGWVSFCGNASGGSWWNGSRWRCPPVVAAECVDNCGVNTGVPTYQVKIRASGGQSYFGGLGIQSWAWNDVVGWISFDCNNESSCGASNYRIQTSAGGAGRMATITSNILDTGSGQTVFNSFIWRGSLPPDTSVQFKLATSNIDTGPWDDSAYFDIGPIASGQKKKLSGAQYNSRRYIRYRAIINSDVWQSASPRIDDIIINWSP